MYNGLVFILMLTIFINRKKDTVNLWENKFTKMDLDIPYTIEKIQIMKKIGPYFPEEILPSVNKALMITEKLIKFYEAMEFIQISGVNYIQNTIPVENNQERLSYIANTIKREFSKEEINRMGAAIETILTMDKFNKLFQILNSILTNPDHLSDPASIINFMEPLMEGKGEKEKKQLRDMTKMLEIMKTLDSPKKTEEKEGDV